MNLRRGCTSAFVVLFAVATALIIASTALEALTARSEVARHGPPGRLVAIRPHRLHIDCRGEGHPIVILEAGRDRFGLDWWPVQQRLMEHTTVCAYDRAGHGWSGRGPNARSAERIADELHELLIRENLEAPYLLVSMDSGAQYSLTYTANHPEKVAGLVWIDTFDEAVIAGEDRWRRAARLQDRTWTALSLLSRLGFWPWVADNVYAERFDAQDPSVRGAQKALLRLPSHFTAAGREAAADEAYLDPAADHALPSPPEGLPSLVLRRTAGEGVPGPADGAEAPRSSRIIAVDTADLAEARWRAMHAAIQEAFAGTEMVDLPSGGPDAALVAPKVISDAILEVVRRVAAPEADTTDASE